MAKVSLVFSYRYPGRYASTVLAGAVEASEALADVALCFPRRPEDLVAETRAALDAGHRVVVAWSSYSPGFAECVAELEALRAQLGRRFLAIAGGVHATAEPADALAGGFDLVCLGEGERALTELLLRLRRNEPPESAPGFARLVDGRVAQTPRPERVALDDWPPFAARHGHYGAVELTRGCIYACRFCQTPFFSKARFRHRSARNVARWCRALREGGNRDVRFISPTALSYGSDDESVNLAAVEELLSRAKEAMGPDGRVFFGTFPSEVRPEHVTPEALALIRRFAHNDNLVIGGQSGSERVLAASKRGHGVEEIVRAVRLAREAGLVPNVDFILGLPGETPQDAQETVALMKRLAELGGRVHGHTFMPLPGTPFRDAPPGRVDEATRRELEVLASKQHVYGQWKAQERLAQALSRRRG